ELEVESLPKRRDRVSRPRLRGIRPHRVESRHELRLGAGVGAATLGYPVLEGFVGEAPGVASVSQVRPSLTSPTMALPCLSSWVWLNGSRFNLDGRTCNLWRGRTCMLRGGGVADWAGRS